MMFPATLIALLSITTILVEAGPHELSDHSPHKRAAAAALAKRASPAVKRCKVKTASPVINAGKHTSTSVVAATSTSSATPEPTSGGGDGGSNTGVIQVTSPVCGASGATSSSSATNGPNGKLSWLNCGIADKGWSPPPVTVSDLISVSLADALKASGSPFQACNQYLSLFQKYAKLNGIPDILLASIAMQESSCVASTTGGAGEQGLMQITKEKCDGAPGGDCKDPEFNIRVGAAYFGSTLKASNNNVLLAMGTYNGWVEGLTVGQATKAASGNCCRCQNNLDYLQQVFNGWIMNIDPYKTNMGQYFNLKRCGN